jgi:dTDP-4-dehydrorhamnose reductase
MEISRVIHDYVIPNNNLHGLYHLSAAPINKYDLLTLVAEIYRKDIEIIPDETLVIDRSLDSTRFRSATGFKPKSWNEMLILMHDFR